MTSDTAHHHEAPRSRIIAAFAAIYLIWGSTYLGIRIAIETMPPLMMGGARFLLAGGALYAWLRWKGYELPSWDHWRNAVVVGALLLGIGNGGVNWAEQKVPSSVTALLIAVTPVWFALLDWLRPGGQRPHARTVIGIIIGFAGMVLLVAPHHGTTGEIDREGLVAVLCAGIAWASGSIYARYTPKPKVTLMGIALQMLAGGALLALMGIATGESAAFSLGRLSARSAWAFAYLTIIGSLVGFTAYSWLLKVCPPSKVSTYAYVNPVIAVSLGWALGGEKLTLQMLLAAAVIVCGVIIISTRPTASNPAQLKVRK
jgi:drug/metabolite transporter (DMT)-like permease